jgi:4-hydroxy-2-oxoheptanedioate aldolase
MNVPETSSKGPKMRPSRILRKLRNGEIVCCYKLNLESGRAAEIAAQAGFDALWADMEHVPNDWNVIERQIWAAKIYDTDVIVRVSRGSYSDYIRPLELDAAGIMVPHLMSLEEARQIVRTTRFHPVGLRPLDGGNADSAYCAIGYDGYLATANRERIVMVQIEDPEPLKDLDAIAALDGIDMLFFGPGDFSQALGAPGKWDHPELLKARKRVAEACRKHGKFAGTVGSPSALPELIAMGYQFFNIGADVVSILQNCNQLLADFKKSINAKKTKSRKQPVSPTLTPIASPIPQP